MLIFSASIFIRESYTLSQQHRDAVFENRIGLNLYGLDRANSSVKETLATLFRDLQRKEDNFGGLGEIGKTENCVTMLL